MNFLADESVDRPVVEGLRQEGFEVSYIVELAPGISDDAVIDLANQKTAILLTADKDFGEMVFRQRLHMHGIVLIRLAGLTPNRKAKIVTLAVRRHLGKLPHSFAVIMPGMLRLRRVGEQR